ncbi:unnamed protein product [Rotaria magnacalcarata]|uniref:Reverse transcriptase domain-containing protein n=3 Tax=Rotaria magnacalcarata TaxID=392030 RepID=A0A816W9B4_9BILA|nr:unnamed protein product [Rotaria magnacalcarata]
MINEWNVSSSLIELECAWRQHQRKNDENNHVYSTHHLLCFNVRGLDLRWGEVSLLSKQLHTDIIILGEVGHIDLSLINAAFSNYNIFYQAGENPHGGVLILIHKNITVSRLPCSLPNVCVIDIELKHTVRIIGIYAPASKTWNWIDLSSLITDRCMVLGDFNIDIMRDGDKADKLLEWMDACSLSAIIPDTNTSLRSERTIDFAATIGIDLSIQAYEGNTTSDHKPILGIAAGEEFLARTNSRTVWPVFSLMLSYVYEFWMKEWSKENMDVTYENFISFLALLKMRCQHYFTTNNDRPSIPKEFIKMLAQSRSLSFRAKRTGDIELRKVAGRLRNQARYELKCFQNEQLSKQLKERHAPGETSRIFWSKTKRHFKKTSASLKGFFSSTGEIINDPQRMADRAADHYGKRFDAPTVMRPHPYVDTPPMQWENSNELIPPVTYPEILNVLRTRKKKQSLDIHGLSLYTLDKIPKNYWHFLVHLYNDSFTKAYIPKKFKEVRMILLAKKDSVCNPDQTRPISLLDSFLKIQEKLFLNRFRLILKDHGLLPENQSGFREGYRLQTPVLFLIEQIYSYMSNSSPVATVFVDFKSAFDQLWFKRCLGKLGTMGIPTAYINWIRAWLYGRSAIIEIQGKRSKWIKIERGGPQGSSLTPSLFITYHSDMADFFPGATSFFFADDLAAVLAGQIGTRFTSQCIDLEHRLQSFMKQLEYYSILSVQPINYDKTHVMFSARAIKYPDPLPKIKCGDHSVDWIPRFKYLGYWLSTKLGWGNIIDRTCLIVRQRTAMINSFKLNGQYSTRLRRVLFSTFVLPYFT